MTASRIRFLENAAQLVLAIQQSQCTDHSGQLPREPEECTPPWASLPARPGQVAAEWLAGGLSSDDWIDIGDHFCERYCL